MSFGKLGSGYIVINGEKYPVQVTQIDQTFGEPPEFRGFFYDREYARGGVIPVGNSPIKNVIFNDPATVVIWNDGTKTVVKCQPGDTYSKETGLALCIAKKYLGNKGNFNEVFKKWIPEEVEIPVEEVEPVEEDAVTGAINLLRSGDIRVGDKVRVVRYGQTYTAYRDWVEDHVKDPADAAKWAEGDLMRDGNIGVVKYLASHERSFEGDIAYIEIAKKCYMINVVGLEKVEEV